MHPDDTDIEAGNIITRYINRPKLLQTWCLADFVSKLMITYPSHLTDPYDSDHEDDPTSVSSECLPTTNCIDITLSSGI